MGVRELTFLQGAAKQKDVIVVVFGYQDRMSFHNWDEWFAASV